MDLHERLPPGQADDGLQRLRGREPGRQPARTSWAETLCPHQPRRPVILTRIPGLALSREQTIWEASLIGWKTLMEETNFYLEAGTASHSGSFQFIFIKIFLVVSLRHSGFFFEL